METYPIAYLHTLHTKKHSYHQMQTKIERRANQVVFLTPSSETILAVHVDLLPLPVIILLVHGHSVEISL